MNHLNEKQLKNIRKNMEIFFNVTGIYCFMIDEVGEIVHSVGDQPEYCIKINQLKENSSPCANAHLQAALQSDLLGDSYIHFCHAELVHITVALSIGDVFRGALVAGPIEMNHHDPYLVDYTIDSLDISSSEKKLLLHLYEDIPVIPTDKARYYADFLNILARDVVEEERVTRRKKQDTSKEQIAISNRILEIREQSQETYPHFLEHELFERVSRGDTVGARPILNDILGYIFLKHNGDQDTIIAVFIGLVVIISRAAVKAGVPYEKILEFNSKYYQEAYNIGSFEKLCTWIVEVLEHFLGLVFPISIECVENKNVIQKALTYINTNFCDTSLSEVADYVNLSPAYFSRFFSKETNMKFVDYVNKVRVEESKKYLADSKYSLSEIAIIVGLNDQSYYSKVFKKIEEVSPGNFRKNHI